MLKDAVRRRFDMVACWSVDRLGRSLVGLLDSLGVLAGAKVDLFLHQQALDTSTPAGKALFQMLGVFAEFERSMIRERVNAGLARARVKGTKSGKPIGRPAATNHKLKLASKALADGASLREAAVASGLSVGRVHKLKAAV
jgi:DNA invertase Pin-like site-specific DNA recombinase